MNIDKKVKEYLMKKALLVLISALMIFSLVSCGEKKEEVKAMEVKEPVAAAVKNPDTFVYGTIGTVSTLDPAVAYDNASGVNINQMYDIKLAKPLFKKRKFKLCSKFGKNNEQDFPFIKCVSISL